MIVVGKPCCSNPSVNIVIISNSSSSNNIALTLQYDGVNVAVLIDAENVFAITETSFNITVNIAAGLNSQREQYDCVNN
jgi:hypothetical protein